MIEELTAMPPGVMGIRVSGRVSGEEMREFQPTWRNWLRPTRSGSSRSSMTITRASAPVVWLRIGR
jgi:hypothetical protein